MILLTALYLYGPVQLFEKDDPGEGVGERDLPERPHLVGPVGYLRREPQRPAEHDRQVAAARHAKRPEPPGQRFGGVPFPELPVERDNVGGDRNASGDAVPLGGENLVGRTAIHVFFGDLYRFDGKVAPQALRIVGAGIGGPTL